MIDYDLDTDDEEWLERYNSESTVELHHLDTDKFETLMDRLERATPDEVCVCSCICVNRSEYLCVRYIMT